jgi:adenylate cyclase
MVLVARSISDPIREVVVAMTEVEHGRTGAFVAVYEPSKSDVSRSGSTA